MDGLARVKRPDHLYQYAPRAGRGLHGRRLRADNRPARRVHGRAWPGPAQRAGRHRHRLRVLVARAVHRRPDSVAHDRSRPGHAARDPRAVADPAHADEMVRAGTKTRPSCPAWSIPLFASSAVADPARLASKRRPTSCKSQPRSTWCRPSSATSPCCPTTTPRSRSPNSWLRAERPVLFVGGGVGAGGATEPLRRLAERLEAPVVMSNNGRGALDDRHPLALTSVPGREVLATADVVLAVGTRFLNGTHPHALAPDAKLVLLNVEPRDLGEPRDAPPHARVRCRGRPGGARRPARRLAAATVAQGGARRAARLGRRVAGPDPAPVRLGARAAQRAA